MLHIVITDGTNYFTTLPHCSKTMLTTNADLAACFKTEEEAHDTLDRYYNTFDDTPDNLEVTIINSKSFLS